MKKICLTLAICFFTSSITIAGTIMSDDFNVVYYSTVEFVETPLSYLKGSVPLEKTIALSRNHYRFKYDTTNRLVSVAFYNGNTPKNPNHTANYLIQAHRMEFAYKDSLESVTFYNTKGEQISVLGNCNAFVYNLNALGFRTSLYFLDSDGNRTENSWNIFEYTWEHLRNGAVIEDRFNANGAQVSLRPSFEFYRLKLFFNAAGHITLMQNIDINGNLVENSSGASQDNLSTNSNGNLLQLQVLNNKYKLEKGNGPNVATGIQKINEFGYEVGLENQDEHGNPIYNSYGICRSKTEYDVFGNLSQRFFYDQENNPTNHKYASYHRLKIEWDKTGNHRTGLYYYSVNNTPALHKTRGYHAVKYTYNSNKELKQLSYLNTNGALVNRTDNGVSYIIYQYNNDGKQIGVLICDKAGNKLK